MLGLKHTPNVVVIMLGTNDSIDAIWQGEEYFKYYYKLIIDQIRHFIKPLPAIFIASPPPNIADLKDSMFMINVTNKILPKLIPEIAKEVGATYIDVFDKMGGDDRSKTKMIAREHGKDSDGIHYGYTTMSKIIF